MGVWTNLNNCIDIVRENLSSDEAEDIIYFLEEYKRLKKMELIQQHFEEWIDNLTDEKLQKLKGNNSL